MKNSCLSKKLLSARIFSLAITSCLIFNLVGLWPTSGHAQGLGTPTTLTFDNSDPSVEPGQKLTVKAFVRDEQGTPLPNVEIKWNIIDKKLEEYVSLGAPVNDPTNNEITIFGLFGDPKSKTPKPDTVPVVARYKTINGTIENILVVHYKAKVEPKLKITFDEKGSTSPLAVAPGAAATLKVNITDESDKSGTPIPKPKVTWAIPDTDKDFISLSAPDPDKPDQITIIGLFSKKTPRPTNVSVIASTTGALPKVIEVRYLATLEPQVDVSWAVVPPAIVADNFGRRIKQEFYCIDVTIGNNTGGDLQISGLSFNLSSDPNKQMIVPISSYGLVRGSLEKRKLFYPRTLTLGIISSVAQLLTGFNPFFHNVNHAKNFAQGITIISNPIEKGVELVWPDALPGELDRLDQQTLRDDKIVPNNTTFKTRVFLPKDILFQPGEKCIGSDQRSRECRNNVIEVKKRLGTMTLVGYQIQREQFLNRVKPIP
jgi:hypothetical protein